MAEDGDVEGVKSKIDALQQASMKIGEAVYKKGDTGAASEEAPKEEDAKEAEYEEKPKKD